MIFDEFFSKLISFPVYSYCYVLRFISCYFSLNILCFNFSLLFLIFSLKFLGFVIALQKNAASLVNIISAENKRASIIDYVVQYLFH